MSYCVSPLGSTRKSTFQPAVPYTGPEPRPWTAPILQQQDSILMNLPTVVCLRILEACGLRHTPMNATSAICKLMRGRILDEVLLIVAGAEAGLEVAREQCITSLDTFADRQLVQRIQNSNNLLHAITWKDFGGAFKPYADVERIVNCARILQGDLAPDKNSLEVEWSESRSWLRRHPQRMNDRAQCWGLKHLVHMVLGPFVTATVESRDFVSEALQDPSLSPEKLERYSRVAAILSAACRIVVSATLSADLPNMERRVQYLRRAERFAQVRSHSRTHRSVKPLGSSVSISRVLASGSRRKAEYPTPRIESIRSPRENSSASLAEQGAGPDRTRKPEFLTRKLESCRRPSDENPSSQIEHGGLSQHGSLTLSSFSKYAAGRSCNVPPHQMTSMNAPPPSMRNPTTMHALDLSRVSLSSLPCSARGVPSRSDQRRSNSQMKTRSPRGSTTAACPKSSSQLKACASAEDVPVVSRSVLSGSMRVPPNKEVFSPTLRVPDRSSMRLRNTSPLLASRSNKLGVTTTPEQLVDWAKEAALPNDRPSEVAALLYKEAFVFSEARRAAPDQLLASLMGVTGLKAGECLALTNAISRMPLDSKEYALSKEVCRN